MANHPEVWQRGPVDWIPPLLQPVAHALLQAGEEAREITRELPQHLLWEKPFGAASPAFHLMHIKGVIDRLFTYARKELLSDEQMVQLKQEAEVRSSVTAGELLDAFDAQIQKALQQLNTVNPDTLTEARGIGKKQIPTTVIGLYFHAAEHSMRHIGQLLVTVKYFQSLQVK